MQAILTLFNKSTSVKKKAKTNNLGLFIFLLFHMKYVEEAGLTDNGL